MNLPCDHQPSLYAESSKLPKALPDNGRIAIIAPAGPAQLDTLTAIKWFEARGYLCRIYPGVTETEGYLAGSDARRLADLHAAFAATDVDAIICLRGGYGSMRLLEGLDYSIVGPPCSSPANETPLTATMPIRATKKPACSQGLPSR